MNTEDEPFQPSEPEFIEQACELCSRKFQAKRTRILHRFFVVRICSACDAQQTADAEAAEEVKQRAARERAWGEMTEGFERICQSDPKRLPKALVAKANAWEWRGGRSLMFAANKAGLGKSRCAFMALRRAFDAGKRCFALQAVRLERLATREIYDDDRQARWAAERALDRARECSVLLLDDIDKPKWTPASEKELFELMDTRHAAMRSTIWTSNTLREDLGALWHGGDNRLLRQRRVLRLFDPLARKGQGHIKGISRLVGIGEGNVNRILREAGMKPAVPRFIAARRCVPTP